MGKRILITRGGWEGHTPVESSDLFAGLLRDGGHDVQISDTLEPYASEAALKDLDLIVQSVTMSKITKEQWQGLSQAVRSGVGFAGWHGGIIDSFRENTHYQWMTGGQWVAHPGNCISSYKVEIAAPDHEIVEGIGAFELKDTEQYYIHVDPAIRVLCTTTFSGAEGETDLYEGGTVMPYAWTKTWGRGRIFVAAWGHTFADFDVPEAREITRRGLLWASR